MRQLFFGDNLEVLRESIEDESVDLIYLDPPFNSKRDYNLLFKSPKGHDADASITAFEDTWHWGEQAEREFKEITKQTNTTVAEMVIALRRFIGENDMMAYLTMMCNRLLELHRVLKPTGSLYLHCDPTASHYLKIVLDSVFGKENFRNEIVWLRHNARSTHGKWPRVHDIIFYFSKSDQNVFNTTSILADERKLPHTLIIGPDGNKYQTYELTAPGRTIDGDSGKPWKGFDPSSMGRHWANGPATMDVWDAKGLIHWPKGGGFPRRKDAEPFEAEDRTVTVGDTWTDIDRINQTAKERLGYPTQKPLALMERIIKASSNPGDIVLDPFCGCGTAVHAAEKLGRRWIGIDITHLAVSLIENRMKDAFPGIEIEVHGTPKDTDSARNLAERDKYQFQWWACSRVNARPYQGKKKGSDGGIDGLIFFEDGDDGTKKIIVSVKGGENVNVGMVKDLIATVQREKAAIGLFVTLASPTRPMTTEAVSAGFYSSPFFGDVPKIQILTIEGLLNGSERPQYQDMGKGGHTFKKAKVEKKREKQGELL